MPITLQPGEQRELNAQLIPIPLETATLYGYVTDADTAQPIVGALVALSGAFAYSGVTDAQGYYEITDIAAGTYDGLVTATGYQPFVF